jgi:hypothetical protein
MSEGTNSPTRKKVKISLVIFIPDMNPISPYKDYGITDIIWYDIFIVLLNNFTLRHSTTTPISFIFSLYRNIKPSHSTVKRKEVSVVEPTAQVQGA